MAGLIVFSVSVVWTGSSDGLCFAPLGIGIALTAWFGLWLTVPLVVAFYLVRLAVGDQNPHDAILLGFQLAISWWCFAYLARAARTLDEPRSAAVFLLLVPGIVAGVFAAYQAFLLSGPENELRGDFWGGWATLWRAQALGIMIPAPPLLAVLTPVWVSLGWTRRQSREPGTVSELASDWTVGEAVEVMGLALAAGVLGIVVAILQARQGVTSWSLWGLSLLVIVWASLRQGLRGGVTAASGGGLLGLSVISALGASQDRSLPVQGNFLAQACVALLVGSSVGWIRASELRYRQIIGHIPVVLYSVRVPRWVPARLAGERPAGNDKGKVSVGETVVRAAEMTLVSPACKSILGCDAESLLGPFSTWLERILPADRELVIAALSQLCLQRQPVTCEYRLATEEGRETRGEGRETNQIPGLASRPSPLTPHTRWLRDTLAPHYSADGHLDGWEGVVEDITEQRSLAYDLRHVSAMLHEMMTHLPAGVYVVQAPFGQPVLVNNRARHLLGQREDLAAGLQHLSTVYRLHRPDGSEYPWEELPITKALRDGSTCIAEDIVVHRADGRHIALVSWAAPVDLGGHGQQPAAVWVFEDLGALKQGDATRQDGLNV